jgi:predicted ATPase
MLNLLHLENGQSSGESVSILVGATGSGKSSFLRKIAEFYRYSRNVVVVSNTPHDRFSRLRGTRRISVGKSTGSPKAIVKIAVVQSLTNPSAMFHQIGSTLNHCGYKARFGFRINPGPLYGKSVNEIQFRQSKEGHVDNLEDVKNNGFSEEYNEFNNDRLELALEFLRRHQPAKLIWLDASESVFEFSRAREFAFVLKHESKLRAWGVLSDIHVYLERLDSDDCIEMHQASSGQLALISSLLFVVTNVVDNPIIIIDEPENSLHPRWQSEYVDKLLTAVSYLNATVIVATHAPLVVTGALGQNSKLVSIFGVKDKTPYRLAIESANKSSIESILWNAFEIVTPANHFVSERIVDEVSRFESGEVSKEQVLALVEDMEEESFDERQLSFFDQVKRLLDKVELARMQRPE